MYNVMVKPIVELRRNPNPDKRSIFEKFADYERAQEIAAEIAAEEAERSVKRRLAELALKQQAEAEEQARQIAESTFGNYFKKNLDQVRTWTNETVGSWYNRAANSSTTTKCLVAGTCIALAGGYIAYKKGWLPWPGQNQLLVRTPLSDTEADKLIRVTYSLQGQVDNFLQDSDHIQLIMQRNPGLYRHPDVLYQANAAKATATMIRSLYYDQLNDWVMALRASSNPVATLQDIDQQFVSSTDNKNRSLIGWLKALDNLLQDGTRYISDFNILSAIREQ